MNTVTADQFYTRTKIVATVGPASDSEQQLEDLIRDGVAVFRVNMAHGSRAEHERTVSRIRKASGTVDVPVAVLIDLAGPKIRLGELRQEPTHCGMGEEFLFVRGSQSRAENEFTSNYERLVDELSVGDRIMLADGTVSMLVQRKDADTAYCTVTAAGDLRGRQGINLPGVKLSVTALTDRDRDNARWAASIEADFVGLSFVRSPADVMQLRELLREAGSTASVIAKIEKPEAIDALDGIVLVADAIMVARGDLGVEIDIAETPVAQKRIIWACRDAQKPVIVATQMLDSMTTARYPTRAEATDVANAILDGADACMLSGETAIGDHPRLVVQTMRRIMYATENLLQSHLSPESTRPDERVHRITSAIVHGTAEVARHLDAKLVVIATRSGATALVKSKQRDFIPTIGVSNCQPTLRQMCLYWGITPLDRAPVEDATELLEFMVTWGQKTGTLHPGDRVVFVTGSFVMPKVHNQILVYEIPER